MSIRVFSSKRAFVKGCFEEGDGYLSRIGSRQVGLAYLICRILLLDHLVFPCISARITQGYVLGLSLNLFPALVIYLLK